MIKKITLLIFSIFALQACGTIVFNPPVYDLPASKVPDIRVTGNVEIQNRQESIEPVILHSYGGTKFQSNYKEVTNTMVTQAKYELQRHGKSLGGGSGKVIGLKVTNLHSSYIAFYWKGTMTYTVTLGDSDPFDITVHHTTGGGARQDLSGSIANGVLALFKDSRVQEYLKN